MQALFLIITGVVGMAIMLFLGIIANTLVGGIVGYVVDMVFPFVTATLNQVAHTQLTAFELGATLGFFGSFFRSTLKNEK